MNRIAEENSARRIKSFDTVLPDEARVEFSRPKRPRMVGGLLPPDGSILWLAGAIVFGAVTLAVAIGLAGRHEAQQRVPEVSAMPGISVQQPAATSALDSMPAPSAERAVVRAPRATLVKPPPPRAVLVRLPQWRIGEERPVMMPYGLEVAARLKGKLPFGDMLPMSGNEVGDTWVIGDSAWVWVTAPGAGSAKWIDP